MAPPKVEMSDFLLAFGPNDTFLARAPNDISRSSLDISPDLSAQLEASKAIRFVVFPSVPEAKSDAAVGAVSDSDQASEASEPSAGQSGSGDPYISYLRKGKFGSKPQLYTPSEDYHPSLTEWLANHGDKSHLQVIANAQGGWWGFSSSGTMQGGPELPRDVRQLLKPHNPHGKVVHLAFGVRGAYIVLFEDGHVDWDLKNCYDVLDEQLISMSPGDLVYASLSAYQAGIYFVAFKNATVLYEFPKGAENLDEDFLAADDLRVIVPCDTAKHTGMPIQKHNGAMKIAGKLALGVVEGIAAGDAEGVSQALVGKA